MLAVRSVQKDLIHIFATMCCKARHLPLFASSSNVHGRRNFRACQIHNVKPADYMTLNSRPSHLCICLYYSTRVHPGVIPAPSLWLQGLLHGFRAPGLKSACLSEMCILGDRLPEEIVTNFIGRVLSSIEAKEVSETQYPLTCSEKSPETTGNCTNCGVICHQFLGLRGSTTQIGWLRNIIRQHD